MTKDALTPVSGSGCVAARPTSLAQLMAEHQHKHADSAQGPRNFGSSSLGQISGISLSGGLGAPPSLSSLASVNPTPGLLSCSLGSLSLRDSKMAGSLPVPLGSLSNAWQASKPVEVGVAGKSSGVGGQGGSPSLAALIQEHQSNSPDLFNSVPGVQLSTNNADTAETQHGRLGLDSLPTLPPPKPPPNAPNPGCFPKPPLSDSVSQRRAASPRPRNYSPLKSREQSVGTKPSSKPHHVDLCALMSQTSPGPSTPRSPVSPRPDRPTHRSAAGVFAEPSVFALTVCVQMRKRRSQCSGAGPQAFPLSKQMARGKEGVQGPPLHHIAPFKFDTPSPDDIVKANQKKAFTRE